MMVSIAGLRSTACLTALLLVSACVLPGQLSPNLAGSDQISVEILANIGRPPVPARGELSFGAVSYTDAQSLHRREAHSAGSFVISRPVRLRIARANHAQGRVAVSAYLTRDCSPCKLKVNGIALSASPTVIATDVLLNSITSYRVELEIPVSAPSGALESEICWQVEEK